MRAAIPFSVIGGFLGAGKTTFLNRLMVRADAPRCTILINDFGDVAIDEALIAEHAGDTVTLKNGCVCCTLGHDLTRSLAKVLDRERRPERIIVEASGVAQPGRIIDVARISAELRADGVIVVFDAGALDEQLDDRWIADTVRAQLAAADVLLPSRLDEMAPARRAAILERVAGDWPGIPILERFDQGWQLFADLAPSPRGTCPPSAPHAPFTARTVVTGGAVDPARLERWLRARADVYRIKGWIRLAGGGHALVQAFGRSLEWHPVERAPADDTTLVFVGRTGLPDSAAIARRITLPGECPVADGPPGFPAPPKSD